MNKWTVPIVGVLLIAAGAWGLSREEFTYTKEEHEANIGNLEMKFKEKESVDIPKWLAGGAIVGGALLILFGRRS